jgi:hypothetical protein
VALDRYLRNYASLKYVAFPHIVQIASCCTFGMRRIPRMCTFEDVAADTKLAAFQQLQLYITTRLQSFSSKLPNSREVHKAREARDSRRRLWGTWFVHGGSADLLCAYDPTRCLCLAHQRTLQSEATLEPGFYRRAPCALKVLGLHRSCLLNPHQATTLMHYPTCHAIRTIGLNQSCTSR